MLGIAVTAPLGYWNGGVRAATLRADTNNDQLHNS